jgi:aliphatic sulfonates family ABC transporter substrate-binding protein
MPPNNSLSRRSFAATALAASLALPDSHPHAASGRIRIGYQKNGALLILKQQRRLEARLAPLGVTVEWFEFSAGPPMLEALNADGIDFAATGDMPPIFAQAAGTDLVYVASQPAPGRSSAILVRTNGPIHSLADLNGRSVAFTKGSSAHNVVVQALHQAGLAWSDIRPIYLAPADASAAFRQGSVEAWSIWDPFYAIAERDPETRVLTNAEGFAPSNSFYLASRALVRSHDRLVREVIAEIALITREIETHQDELARVMAAATGIPEDIQRIAAARGNYDVGFITEAVIAQQQHIADSFRSLRLIPTSIRIRDAVWAPAA